MQLDLKKKHLGRYPFTALIPSYVEHRSTYMAASTVTEDERKLRYFAKIFRQLKAEGKIGTTDPRNMTQREIEAFLRFTKAKGIQESARRKYLAILGSFLDWAGNDIIGRMRTDKRVRFPKDSDKAPIRALTPEEIERILQSAERIEGWKGTVLRGFIALGFATGCRPKELFMAETADVDLERMRFFVRHPKGEMSWGRMEWIPIIRGDMLPWIGELMDARKALENGGLVSQYLFCNKASGEAYSGNGIRALKQRTVAETGIKWKLKDLRSSLTSITVSEDVSKMKAVSLQLRHASVTMTEHYYARITRDEAIIKSIGEEWKKHPIKRS